MIIHGITDSERSSEGLLGSNRSRCDLICAVAQFKGRPCLTAWRSESRLIATGCVHFAGKKPLPEQGLFSRRCGLELLAVQRKMSLMMFPISLPMCSPAALLSASPVERSSMTSSSYIKGSSAISSSSSMTLSSYASSEIRSDGFRVVRFNHRVGGCSSQTGRQLTAGWSCRRKCVQMPCAAIKAVVGNAMTSTSGVGHHRAGCAPRCRSQNMNSFSAIQKV